MAGLWSKLGQWSADAADRKYISQMGDLIEADVGLTQADMQDLLSSRSDTRPRMLAMAARYGVTQDYIDAERWRLVDMTRACGHCTAEGTCARFLEHGGALEEADGFCPNAAEYRALAAEAAG